MRRPARHLLFPVLALLGAAACTDRNPAGSPQAPPPEPPPSAVAMMTCTVSVRAGTLACGGADVASGISATIIGGQGTYVRLASSGVSYDSAASTLRVDVTVENLTGQALGTADGVTPSDDGVRVFFQSGPTATEGDGPVAVANADGEGVFTGAGQKYFEYEGILAPGDTTAPREWRFSMPGTVSAFTFGVYVAAPVRAEEGWISMSPLAPAVAVGDTQRIGSVVRNVAGGPLTTSNAAVATVDAQGLVTGVAAGTATVTATSGGRTGSVEVLVHAPTAEVLRPPAFLAFRVEGASVTSGSPADSVKLRLEYRGTGIYSPYLRVTLRHPSGIQRECVSHTNFEWVGDNREMWCGHGMPDGILGGAWKVDRIEFSGRIIQHAALLAAGAPAYVHVHTANEDRDGPTLDSLIVHSDTLDGSVSLTLAMDLWAGDRMYADRAEAFIGSEGNPRLTFTGSPLTAENGRTPYQFRNQIPNYYKPGTFRLDSLRLRDGNGNRRTIARAELAARGYRTEFTVIGTAPDTVPPAITEYSFSPQTVAGNGADSVTVTLSAEEPVDESGVWFLDMEFEKLADTTQRRRCLRSNSTRLSTLTMTCRQAFGAGDAGEWRVRYIRAMDFMNQSRVYFTADIQAAGYPTQLTVTPP
jgi:hypothetical protein